MTLQPLLLRTKELVSKKVYFSGGRPCSIALKARMKVKWWLEPTQTHQTKLTSLVQSKLGHSC
ncbi:hypothetical protein SLEP1_g42002 [Rubroshorea leprosula]|uniref:Uncharacterized protein n=1 Tax=Rubroshorea leprosula TaxID=152421 RepID=A0AAV5L8N6_9ROSI|nr:hypothetical protein SLEP1_g42002 [Rubroshorea leprosula]